MSEDGALRQGPLDAHAHIVPDGLLARLAAGERPGFAAADGAGAAEARKTVRLGAEARTRPLLPGMHDMAARLREMDRQGVAAQLLSPWVGLCGYDLPEADGEWLAEAVNAEIGAVVRAMPDRFVGLGSAPLQAPERTPAILREAIETHGLKGVLVAATAGAGRPLDDSALAPFWAAAEELGAFVMIHPDVASAGAQFQRYYFNNLIHNPLETTLAAAGLIFGGVLERHPGLKICLVHGGGLLPYNIGRLVRGRAVRPETATHMTGSVEDSFARFCFDTVTHWPPALRYLVSEVGASRVLLGTDFPFDMGDPDPLGTVAAAGLAPADAATVIRCAAARWLGA